jgi:hypothetical protein
MHYRDELDAAQARIAALEDEVRLLRAESEAPAELEAALLKAREELALERQGREADRAIADFERQRRETEHRHALEIAVVTERESGMTERLIAEQRCQLLEASVEAAKAQIADLERRLAELLRP